MLKPWDEIPVWMRTPEVKEYYDILKNRKGNLVLERV